MELQRGGVLLIPAVFTAPLGLDLFQMLLGALTALCVGFTTRKPSLLSLTVALNSGTV